ncbi:hypothetical protein XBFM1_520083 [Xenorhabdus bovienii str. feltiae Moldova]|uniref:Uncharacterized protein n=1 Tax=Xenorhabdus bovienii str. feltiae Moldova TaxID=1398200 RepID=A0A077NZJ2_XENBV|nr:hypothetical protein XBFM1_520083 [Xenorhabdus bovienii str. feltiae Moldova]
MGFMVLFLDFMSMKENTHPIPGRCFGFPGQALKKSVNSLMG